MGKAQEALIPKAKRQPTGNHESNEPRPAKAGRVLSFLINTADRLTSISHIRQERLRPLLTLTPQCNGRLQSCGEAQPLRLPWMTAQASNHAAIFAAERYPARRKTQRMAPPPLLSGLAGAGFPSAPTLTISVSPLWRKTPRCTTVFPFTFLMASTFPVAESAV